MGFKQWARTVLLLLFIGVTEDPKEAYKRVYERESRKMDQREIEGSPPATYPALSASAAYLKLTSEREKMTDQEGSPPPAYRKLTSERKKMNSLDKVINRFDGKPVLVDFYATWCGPCQTMLRRLGEINVQTGGMAEIVKIDVDKDKETAAEFKVSSLPTLVLFKDGEVTGRWTGVQEVSVLADAIRKGKAEDEAVEGKYSILEKFQKIGDNDDVGRTSERVDRGEYPAEEGDLPD